MKQVYLKQQDGTVELSKMIVPPTKQEDACTCGGGPAAHVRLGKLPSQLFSAKVLVFLPVHLRPVCAEHVKVESVLAVPVPSWWTWDRGKMLWGGADVKCQRWILPLVLGPLLCALPLAVAQVEQTVPQVLKVPQAKPGSKDDIQAIGNRKIGGSGLGNWYSLEHEISIGRDYSREIEGSVKLIQDPVVTEYVNRIGQNLVRNSDAKVPFTIKVIDSEEVNAFALPGGFLYVNSGLVLAAEDEAELAGVMAHEIAHVAARHATRQMTRSQMFNLASIPLVFVGGGLGVAVQQAAGLAIPLSLTKFSRGFETEADYLGVEYLYKAGYDPQAFISFFERVQAQEKQKPGLIAKAFSDHPQTADRMKKTQREIAAILPAREAYVVSTSDFEEVKARLTTIENRHRTVEQDAEHPTLRRRAADGNDSEDGEERPTLKRRGD